MPKGKPTSGGFQFHPENINRKGRPPKGYSLSERIREFLESNGYEIKLEEEIAGPELDGMDRMDLLVRAIFRSALGGSAGAMRIIRDSVDGLPVQNIRLNGAKKGLVIKFSEAAENPLDMFSASAPQEKEEPDIEMNDKDKEPDSAP